MRCIRTSRYKLIRYFDYHNGYVPANIDASPSKDSMIEAGLLKQTREREMLFDLALDPLERKNLVNSSDYKEVYDDLRLRLENWMERTGDPLLRVGYRVPKPEGAWAVSYTHLVDLLVVCIETGACRKAIFVVEINLGNRLLRADHGRYGIIDGLHLGIGLLSAQPVSYTHLHTFSFPVIITAALKMIFITNHFFH